MKQKTNRTNTNIMKGNGNNEMDRVCLGYRVVCVKGRALHVARDYFESIISIDFAYRRSDGVYVVPIGCLKN